MAQTRWLRATLSGAVLLAAVGLAWGAPVVLTVVPEAQVHGPHITLGEVAEVQGEPADTVARLRQVVLGQAPPAGVVRQLSRSSIVTSLRHGGFAVRELELKGATRVRVTRAAQRLDPRQMEPAVRQALSERLPQTAARTMIRDIRGLHTVFVAQGPVRYEVTVPGQRAVLGPASFALTISVADRVVKRLHGLASIAIVQEVVSLTRPVAQDEVITADAVTLTEVEVTQPLRQVVTQLEEVIGKRARRALAGHTPLSPRDVVTAPVVQKGDVVNIVLESPLIKVTTVGEALEAGQPGETIRVKNTASNREVRAQVIDKHTVRIQL